MILVDTSVWIELIRRRIRVDRMELRRFVTCGPILQEVLQGLDDGAARELFRAALLAVPRLDESVSVETFLEASEIFRRGRRKGYTIRSSIDCLIAAIAIRHDVAVWHKDRDFESIARFTSLRTRLLPSVN